MTKFRATAAAIAKGYSMAFGYPNEKRDPNDPDSPEMITVVFGPKASAGEVLEADIPEKYAKRLLRRTTEKDPMIELVPPSK